MTQDAMIQCFKKVIIKKLQKNHGRKKQLNTANLAGPFHNHIMNLAILIFSSKFMLLFRMF